MSVIKIITHQILGSGHRRYDGVELLGIKSDNAITLGYARFSSHDQKTDLETQKQVLKLFCAQQGWQHQVIEDLGSGLNYSKRSRERSIKMIIAHQVKKLGLTYQDRLLRFSSELTFSLWEH